uniref:Putative LAGLIDADG homing endonuclease n=1 Tax=Staurocarteria crucifera TaxID=47781 RepID=A0A0S2ICA1_9CHLO|nr:putative LAGLIDADG homing endonuclease [Carteria crucifera]
MSKKLSKNEIEQIAKDRNHVLITPNFEQVYQNVQSRLEFKCLTCGATFEASVHSYKNAKKTGCPGCKKVKASETHTGKTVSEKTRALISEKASQRPGSLTNKFGEAHPRFKGGYGRDKKSRSSADYVWMNSVKKLCNYKCVLTDAKTNLHCHHLNSWNIAVDKRHDLANGVLIEAQVHNNFHTKYGYGNNTEAQFAEFCQTNYGVCWSEIKQRLFSS